MSRACWRRVLLRFAANLTGPPPDDYDFKKPRNETHGIFVTLKRNNSSCVRAKIETLRACPHSNSNSQSLELREQPTLLIAMTHLPPDSWPSVNGFDETAQVAPRCYPRCLSLIGGRRVRLFAVETHRIESVLKLEAGVARSLVGWISCDRCTPSKSVLGNRLDTEPPGSFSLGYFRERSIFRSRTTLEQVFLTPTSIRVVLLRQKCVVSSRTRG